MRPRYFFLLAACPLLLVTFGCADPAQVHPKQGRSAAGQADTQDVLFKQLADTLNRLDEFDSNLPLVRDRLNHWVRQQPSTAKRPADPLLDTFPADLRELPIVKQLDRNEFSVQDVQDLQTVGWLRDISRQARIDQFDELAVAEKLFDWTVRNLQLEPDALEAELRTPGEILLTGHATALERAWIFALLARQQKLDVVLLSVAGEADAERPYMLAALVSDKHLYLFDPRLGLPIPGADGDRVATFASVQSDDGLLRKLDLDAEHSYPLTAEALKKVTAWLEASPVYLAQNMRVLEARLSGKQAMVLWLPAEQVAERVKAAGVEDVRLWPRPYQLIVERSNWSEEETKAANLRMFRFQIDTPLRKGRMAQFHGVVDGDKGAKKAYLSTRPSQQQLKDLKDHPETFLPPEAVKHLKLESLDRLVMQQVKILEMAKEDASFFLGLVAYDEGNYPIAIDYFAERTLKVSPSGPRAAAASYNLARAYEASDRVGEAIEIYENDKSPQSHGNRLRARALQAAIESAPTEQDAPAATDESP